MARVQLAGLYLVVIPASQHRREMRKDQDGSGDDSQVAGNTTITSTTGTPPNNPSKISRDPAPGALQRTHESQSPSAAPRTAKNKTVPVLIIRWWEEGTTNITTQQRDPITPQKAADAAPGNTTAIARLQPPTSTPGQAQTLEALVMILRWWATQQPPQSNDAMPPHSPTGVGAGNGIPAGRVGALQRVEGRNRTAGAGRTSRSSSSRHDPRQQQRLSSSHQRPPTSLQRFQLDKMQNP